MKIKADKFYPDARYHAAMAVSITLIYVIAVFWWSIPGGILLLREVMSTVAAVIVTLVTHGALLLVSLWMGAAYVRRLRYEILTDEVIIYAGLITQSVRHVPFRAVTNLKVTRGPIERLFGLGTLHVETAGTSGQNAAAEGTLVGLGDVQAVYDLVAAELHRYRSALAPTQAGSDVSADGRDADLLAELLDEVRAIRARLDHGPISSG